MKSTPNLPASSRMKNPSGGGPSIKGALQAKPLAMSKGVPAKGPIKGAGKGATKKAMKGC
ncbi:MAG: hypothetical protein RLY61_392 [Candidatus Parcubacteria bacterium]|jgi:hypothetical protein